MRGVLAALAGIAIGLVPCVSSAALPACRSMTAVAGGGGVRGAVVEGLVVAATGAPRLGVAVPGNHFSEELGLLLEDAAGVVCQVQLPAGTNTDVQLRGPGRWHAVEVGVCDPALGSCTLVRVTYAPPLRTAPR